MDVTEFLIGKIYGNWVSEARKEWQRSYLGASNLGHNCQRYLWFQFLQAFKPDFPGRILRLFDRGHREEPVIQEELRKLGVKLSGDQYEVSTCGGHIKGHFDGVGNFDNVECSGINGNHLLEYKTMSTKAFEKLQNEGVYKAQEKHFAQMQFYMHQTKGLRQAVYIVINKDNDEIYMEIVKYDKAIAEGLVAKGERIVKAIDPPIRIADKPASKWCTYCDAKEVCWERAAQVNCRTCRFGSPRFDGNGKWVCTVEGEKDLSKDRQRVGCPSHQYKPALVHGVDHDQTYVCDEYTEYTTLDGGKFRNGEGWTPSKDIYGVGANVQALHDETVLKIKDQFNGEFIPF